VAHGEGQDAWARWLLERRHGADPHELERVLRTLTDVREHVLDHARIAAGEVVLDVGCGDGLIAFGALQRVGEQGRVIFSDISQDLLDHCRSLAESLGRLDQCTFVRASAEDLGVLADASVDAVTTRSVLIYMKDKPGALREFHRVLKPGGRLSIFEPINRFAYPEPPHRFMGYDVTPVQDLAMKLLAAYARAQSVCENTMLDFDERDLLRYAEGAGFVEVQGDLHLEVVPYASARMVHPTSSWEAFWRSAPNPLAPTLEEALAQGLTPAEAERFVAHLRPLVEARRGIHRLATLYLWALKEGERVDSDV
jgi:ubiquinone/menaquinone biosynthesis C-methylase UbiE